MDDALFSAFLELLDRLTDRETRGRIKLLCLQRHSFQWQAHTPGICEVVTNDRAKVAAFAEFFLNHEVDMLSDVLVRLDRARYRELTPLIETKMLQRQFNAVSASVTSMLLAVDSEAKHRLLKQRLIECAAHCFSACSYNMAMCLTAGLAAHDVSRLHVAGIPAKYGKTLEQLELCIQGKGNYSALRALEKGAVESGMFNVVPFTPMHLRDIITVRETAMATKDVASLIAHGKAVESYLRFQLAQKETQLKAPALLSLLSVEWPCFDEDERDRLSGEWISRGLISQHKTPPLSLFSFGSPKQDISLLSPQFLSIIEEQVSSPRRMPSSPRLDPRGTPGSPVMSKRDALLSAIRRKQSAAEDKNKGSLGGSEQNSPRLSSTPRTPSPAVLSSSSGVTTPLSKSGDPPTGTFLTRNPSAANRDGSSPETESGIKPGRHSDPGRHERDRDILSPLDSPQDTSGEATPERDALRAVGGNRKGGGLSLLFSEAARLKTPQ